MVQLRVLGSKKANVHRLVMSFPLPESANFGSAKGVRTVPEILEMVTHGSLK